MIAMFYYMGLLFLIIGVSIDGFGVGITYGLRRVQVPFLALGIIMFCSGIIVFLSMVMGNVLKAFISPALADSLGGVILLLLGLYYLIQNLRSSKPAPVHQKTHKKTWGANFKTVIKEPSHADLDHSGSISAKEAVFLGFALALDAFGAGLGAAMLGYPALLSAFLIAVMSGLFVLSGVRTGLLLSGEKGTEKLSLLPPFLLILIGMFHIL